MAISHIKSAPVADFTGTVTVFDSQGSTKTVAATDLVRPVDWNSVHNITYQLSGNTSNASSAGGTDVVLSAGNGITLAGNGSTLSVIGQGATMSTWVDPYQMKAHTTGLIVYPASGGTSNAASFWPLNIPYYLSAGFIQIPATVSFTSNTSNDTMRNTQGYSYVLYSRLTNSQSSRLSSITGSQHTWNFSVSSTSHSTTFYTTSDYTGFGNVANGNATGTAAAVSKYTGNKLLHLPINSLLTPGQYWLGMIFTESTSSRNSGKFQMSLYVHKSIHGSSVSVFAPLNGLTSDATSDSISNMFYRYAPMLGWGSYSEAGLTSLPGTVAISAISQIAATSDMVIPLMAIWRT